MSQIQSDQMRASFQKLYLNKELSDIDLVQNSNKIPAHRLVLAVNSDFFKVLCYGDFKEASTREVHIKDAPEQEFLKILQYLYFGEMDLGLESLYSVLVLLELSHRFGIKNLENEIIQHILKSRLDVETAPTLYCVGKELEFEVLKNKSLELIKPSIFMHSTFLNLCETSVGDILKACNWKPIDKCIAIVEWVKFQKEWTEVKEISKLIDLSKLTREEILHIVVPSKIFDSSDLIDALVLKGMILTDITPGPLNESGFRYRSAKRKHDSVDNWKIELALESSFTFNHIEFDMYRHSSYYVAVSENKKTWKNVIDYRKFVCYTYQDLYFEPVHAKYIRIVSTSQIHSNNFKVLNVAKGPPLIPHPEFCSIACLDKNEPIGNHFSKFPFCVLPLETITHSAPRGDGMIVLYQPFWMDSFRLRVRDQSDETKYLHSITVRVFDHETEGIVYSTKELVEGWHDIRFEPRIVKTIHVSVENMIDFSVDIEHISE